MPYRLRFTLCLIALLASLTATHSAAAQATPTASQPLRAGIWGGLTGTYTGLDGSRNAGITAGVDIGLHPLFRIHPSLEVRGTYPINNGSVVAMKDALGGLRFDTRVSRIRPYVTILAGRGEMNYLTGYRVPGTFFVYQLSHTSVYSVGGGFDYDIGHHLALKFDGQLQHWSTPVNTIGHVYAKSGTVAVVYQFHSKRVLR